MKDSINKKNMEINKFSFGCYGLGIIWAIFNKCWEYIGLFVLVFILCIILDCFGLDFGQIVPIISNLIYFIFSFFALKFSYKRQNKSVTDFLTSQKKWDIAGAIIYIFIISIYMFGFNRKIL